MDVYLCGLVDGPCCPSCIEDEAEGYGSLLEFYYGDCVIIVCCWHAKELGLDD